MAEAERIDPQQAHHDMQANHALLVCAYESQEKFENNHLEDALSLDEFNAQADSIPKDRELIFYCA
jgi:rhodanese-related sulfurtransferase